MWRLSHWDFAYSAWVRFPRKEGKTFAQQPSQIFDWGHISPFERAWLPLRNVFLVERPVKTNLKLILFHPVEKFRRLRSYEIFMKKNAEISATSFLIIVYFYYFFLEENDPLFRFFRRWSEWSSDWNFIRKDMRMNVDKSGKIVIVGCYSL